MSMHKIIGEMGKINSRYDKKNTTPKKWLFVIWNCLEYGIKPVVPPNLDANLI